MDDLFGRPPSSEGSQGLSGLSLKLARRGLRRLSQETAQAKVVSKALTLFSDIGRKDSAAAAERHRDINARMRRLHLWLACELHSLGRHNNARSC